MTQEITTKIQRLESIDDVNNLQYGNIVEIKYLHISSGKQDEFNGLYFGNDLRLKYEKIRLLVPVKTRKKSIMSYNARLEQIQVDEGKIVFFEGRVGIGQYDVQDSNYSYYDTLLKRAGLR